jgi:hypothetical protein
MCAEARTILRAVVADFFFNCWYLEILSDSSIVSHLRKYQATKEKGINYIPIICARNNKFPKHSKTIIPE